MNEFPMEYDTVILVPSALELEIDGRLMDVFFASFLSSMRKK